MEKKKLSKLVLNKSVVSSLSQKEEVKIKGGAITNNCQTFIHEGCYPEYSWDDCSEDCTYTCNTAGDFTCLINNCQNYTYYWY
jgi:hypothetical protein